jgi:hypothetical protein
MKAFMDGAAFGLRECQYQFSPRRWNCTTADRSRFETVVNAGSRETAFVYAVAVAGIVYSVARDCALEDLRHCGCDSSRLKETQHQQDDWVWGGCGDNIEYALKFNRDFILLSYDRRSRRDKELVARNEMDRHNIIAGGEITKATSERKCQCHGFSGSCAVQSCWKQLPGIHKIGLKVRGEFDGAVKVGLNDSDILIPKNRFHVPPTKLNLVYLDKSPNYCSSSSLTGSFGTSGRECNASTYGLGSCSMLCCNRGYYAREIVLTESCDCLFIWCCKVECKTCTKKVIKHFCN